jgi:pimeloyl-ACP methyl ester carboxylesterase
MLRGGLGRVERVTTYDELGYLADNAAEAGLPWSAPPPVERRTVTVDAGRTISALAWGAALAQAVVLHGRAQNAHTWDTVALALQADHPRPLVALDLPGHGQSGWRDDHDYRPATVAHDLSRAADELAGAALLVVGMSLGGLAALSWIDAAPDRFDRLILVDITPGVDAAKARSITDFTAGPERFASFEELLDRTVRYNPGRSPASLRRGVLHNAHELPDGSWAWRWDPQRLAPTREGTGSSAVAGLWDVIEASTLPLTLIRGGASSVVDDADVAELLRRRPDAEVVAVPGAGHSIQGDHPVELAALLAQRWPAA